MRCVVNLHPSPRGTGVPPVVSHSPLRPPSPSCPQISTSVPPTNELLASAGAETGRDRLERYCRIDAPAASADLFIRRGHQHEEIARRPHHGRESFPEDCRAGQGLHPSSDRPGKYAVSYAHPEARVQDCLLFYGPATMIAAKIAVVIRLSVLLIRHHVPGG